MELIVLIQRPQIKVHKKLDAAYSQLEKLISALLDREFPDTVVEAINKDIEALNLISDTEKSFRTQIFKKQSKIIKLLEQELKLVTKGHYRNMWLAVGMAAFGIPMGVVLGVILDNMAFLGIGLPFGMAIGIAVGTRMDKKAFEEGRQLDIEI